MMLQIQNVTDDSLQKMTLLLPDGSSASLVLYFVPMQYSWYILSLTYGTFSAKGIRICSSPNLLHQFRNQIPFGLACVGQGKRCPQLQQDFKSGQSTLYILTAAEVAAYTAYLTNG